MIMTLMLPVQVQVIPEYILFAKLGWLNTFWPLLLPRIGGQAFFIFMIMQFIRGIPRELDDAAAIDGCGQFGIFWRIIVPLRLYSSYNSSTFCTKIESHTRLPASPPCERNSVTPSRVTDAKSGIDEHARVEHAAGIDLALRAA